MPKRFSSISALNKAVCSCRACPRLVAWREEVAEKKRASYRDHDYWGKALPGFGDPKARLLVVGLAPAAHGANRTGRMFTGDRSGEWLYRALHKSGYGSKPESIGPGDGLEMTDAYITAIVRCAPPLNKPTTEERNQCVDYFKQELRLMPQVKVLLALGSFAWQGILKTLEETGISTKPKPRFGHATSCRVGPYHLVGSYHPSQQNTFTGRLTEPMFDEVFAITRNLLDG